MLRPDVVQEDSQTDGALARAVTGPPGGDAVAEAELYRRFAPRVRLFGLRHLRNEAAADDLVQQVMLVVIERLRAGEVRNPDQVGSFILGTSRMVTAGLKRTEWRRERLRARFEGEHPATTSTDERAVDQGRVTPCLAELRDRERTVLILSFYAEKTAPEVATALGMTPGAVRVCRHRALASLRACVEARRSS